MRILFDSICRDTVQPKVSKCLLRVDNDSILITPCCISEINCQTRQVLGSEVTAKEREYFLSLRDSVVGCDVMVDKLVIKDVQLTAANDDNYFVFEDTILQVTDRMSNSELDNDGIFWSPFLSFVKVLLCFSRDTDVLASRNSTCSSPARALLRYL